jgi:hypothetical protein
MSANVNQSISVRIIRIPSLKMARSGKGDLNAFDQWWSALNVSPQDKLCPRDFMWYNPQIQSFEWLYALPTGMTDTAGYEVYDFPGGLFAVATCKDDGPEIETTTKQIYEWIEQGAVFEKAPETSGLYEMGHVITPKVVKEILGYHQMDLFVPIVTRSQVS